MLITPGHSSPLKVHWGLLSSCTALHLLSWSYQPKMHDPCCHAGALAGPLWAIWKLSEGGTSIICKCWGQMVSLKIVVCLCSMRLSECSRNGGLLCEGSGPQSRIWGTCLLTAGLFYQLRLPTLMPHQCQANLYIISFLGQKRWKATTLKHGRELKAPMRPLGCKDRRHSECKYLCSKI